MERFFTRWIPGDPVIIWEQSYDGKWAQFTLDLVDGFLDIAVFANLKWHHTATINLQESHAS